MITMKDIIRDDQKSLREKSEKVEFPLNEDIKESLNKMYEFLINSQDEEVAEKYNLRPGVGIAAPQIGINKQFTVIHFEYDDKLYSYKLINPKIISHSVEQAYLVAGEGCLSVDDDYEGYVLRHARITVKAFNEDGIPFKLRLKGYPAIVFQHEIDHLNGLLFYDHINKENPSSAPHTANPISYNTTILCCFFL